MNTPISTPRHPVYRLMLLSAALLIFTGRAFAADVVGDAQMQAKALLTGTSGGRPNAVGHPISTPTNGRQRSNTDPQEQARRLILGANNHAGQVGQASAVSARETRVFADASRAARRMILGFGG